MKDALDQVRQIGYGIVPPVLEEMSLDQPEIIRHGGEGSGGKIEGQCSFRAYDQSRCQVRGCTGGGF